jgi:hypothetical protein
VKRPDVAEPQEKRTIEIVKLGEGILLKRAKRFVVMEEKAADGSTRHCGPSWGLDEWVSGRLLHKQIRCRS